MRSPQGVAAGRKQLRIRSADDTRVLTEVHLALTNAGRCDQELEQIAPGCPRRSRRITCALVLRCEDDPVAAGRTASERCALTRDTGLADPAGGSASIARLA